MQKQIQLGSRLVSYSLRKTGLSKSLRISISGAGKLTVSSPLLIPQLFIDRFLHSKSDWILQHLEKVVLQPTKSTAQLRSQYIRNKPIARKIANARLEYFNQFYNLKYKHINIRDQFTRWGSCTKDGNLSFNYRIALLPPELTDLVIVHELCHLQEMNHSDKFWGLVSKTIPNFRILRRRLRNTKLESL